MRLCALLLLVVTLAACGGGSGSDDTDDGDENTTDGAAVVATTGTDDDSNAAADGGSVEGRLQKEVVTDVEPMTEPEGASGARAVMSATFDTEQSSKFLVGDFENGAMTEVVDGTYRVEPAESMTQIMLPTSIPSVNDGVIDVHVSLEGNGAAGVSIRTRKDPQGTFSGYVCWISEPTGAGCSSNTKDSYTLLFSAPADSVALQDMNQIRVAMIGETLQFEVNGAVVGQVTDTGFVAGNWGLYAESSADGTATATFDEVTVYRTTNAYQLP